MAARRFLLAALCAGAVSVCLTASASGYDFYEENVAVDAPDPSNVQITSSCTSGGSTACVVYDYDFQELHGSGNSCDARMVPDLPTHAFVDSQNHVQMLMGTSGDAHRLMGPDLDSIVPEQVAQSQYQYGDARPCASNILHDREPVGTCAGGASSCQQHVCATTDARCHPDSFHNSEWLDAPWTADGTTIHALIHNEFHGDYWEGQCDFTKPDGCYYSSVTYARSTDGGAFYNHTAATPNQATPPLHLVAEAPYKYVKNGGHVGFAAPTNIVKSGSSWATIVISRGRGVGPADPIPQQDGFVYDDVDPNYFKDQPTGRCAIRTTDINNPSSWEAWSGTGFNNTLTNPYTYPLYAVSPPAQHACTPLVGLTETRADGEWSFMKDFAARSLVLDKTTGHYILVGVCTKQTAFCYSWSSTLTGYWSAPVPIMHISDTCPTTTRAQYPSIIDPTPPADPGNPTAQRNFETMDDSGYVDMFFKRFNCASGGSIDSDLLRVKLRLTAPH